MRALAPSPPLGAAERRRRRTPLVVGVLLLMLTAYVLRAPTDVLARFVPPADVPERAAPAADSVPDDVTTDSDVGAGGPAGTVIPPTVHDLPQGSAGGDADGRWGPPATRPTSGLILEELRGGWRVESGMEEAAALAVVAAHAWATERGLVTRTPGGTGGAIVTVEAMERPGAHHGVVTLLIADDAALHRLAVPVRLAPDRPAIAGPPWPLPAPSLAALPVDGTPIGDEELIAAARRALEHVGIPGARMVALEVTEGWPFIARLDDDTDGHPWLRWHVDRFVVAGLPLDAAGERSEER